MFLKHYYDALTEGEPKAAFDAGKTFSDIIAMVNRAFWLLAFALVVARAQAGLGDAAAWYETFAMWTSMALCGWALPAMLAVQILFIAFRSLDEVKDRKWRIGYKCGVFVLAVLLISTVNFSWTAIKKDLDRQETEKVQIEHTRRLSNP